MNMLVCLNRIGAAALTMGFFALLYGHYQYDNELDDLKFAIAQSKKGDRFTADDGRALCAVVAQIRPDLSRELPDVCRTMTPEPSHP